MKGEARDRAAMEAARSVPPREHGGNCDIKDLIGGGKINFPVCVDGAGLSVGDLHFSQGGGETTFCGAIEMAGWLPNDIFDWDMMPNANGPTKCLTVGPEADRAGSVTTSGAPVAGPPPLRDGRQICRL